MNKTNKKSKEFTIYQPMRLIVSLVSLYRSIQNVKVWKCWHSWPKSKMRNLNFASLSNSCEIFEPFHSIAFRVSGLCDYVDVFWVGICAGYHKFHYKAFPVWNLLFIQPSLISAQHSDMFRYTKHTMIQLIF